MIAWNFQKIVGTCQFRVPWFGYPCCYSSLTKLEALKTAREQENAALEQGTITQEQYNGLQREIIATEQALEALENRPENLQLLCKRFLQQEQNSKRLEERLKV